MSKKFSKKPLALALGAAFGMTGISAQAALFQVADLGTGYMVAQTTPAAPATPAKPAKPAADAATKRDAEGKCGEGKCGADKTKAAAEGKCGADKTKAAAEGKCGADKQKAAAEGKCGEGKCGGKK